MSDTGATPVARGQTLYGHSETIPSTYVQSVALEGREHVSKAYDPANAKVRRNARDVKTMLVRNTSGGALLPGQLVTWEAGYRGRRVDGAVCVANAEIAGVVDDMLPAAGVRNGDIFHLIVSGPCLGLLSRVAADAVVNAGDVLFAATAATSGAVTAGRFKPGPGTFSATAATDGTMLVAMANAIGRAISACTAADTGKAVLIDLKLG